VPGSAIRDLLSVVRRRDVISLAGGLPDPGCLPAAEVAQAAATALRAPDTLQYGPTEGEPELREWIAQHELGGVDPDRVIVTHGAQQALQLAVDALVDPGSAVVVERSSYIGMLQPLLAAGADLHDVEGDHDGVRTLELAELLGTGLDPALCYLAPTHQNPTGSVLAPVRRQHLGRLARAHRVVVVDDDPYRSLGFDGPAPERLRTHVPDELAVTVGSFSKVLSPGLRVGWVHGPRWLIDAVVRLKQAADLHTGTLDQRIVVAMVRRDGWLEQHLATTRRVSRHRAEVLVDAVQSMTGGALRAEMPTGGMFLWAQLDEAIGDTDRLALHALDAGVAIVAGSAFDHRGRPSQGARLCYASEPPNRLVEAAGRLAVAVDRCRDEVVAASSASTAS
jgi:DNA-binding transcriptional MocR family regulator